ncbi:MAG TPA: pyridoxine 5'-phosphate synthase [Longimicrobiales bacterium]|nr:pyridoxine 5'-phosphate synthase [Longimicrobiales bacterium]
MRLHINVDHVATVRQARRTDEPDPVRAAVLAEIGGADGITVHLREDRRHIQDRDVRLLMETVRTGVNLELAAASDVLDIACELRPMAATLVPERREEVTTEGGLELGESGARARVEQAVGRLRETGIRTALFVAPDLVTIDVAAALVVDAVELHTGEFAEAWRRVHTTAGRAAVNSELTRLRRAAAHARTHGIDVHAGHGLTYENVAAVAAIGEVEELNIGHSVVSRAVLVGMERAVREMKDAMREARRAGLHGD